jgi:hypothetical protein
MKNKITFLISFVVAIWSCQDDKDVQLDAINYNTTLTDTSIVDSLIYIPLINQKIVGNVQSVIAKNHRFYMLDNATSSISVYDSAGELKYVLDKFGKGPEEYTSINDYTINDNDEIVVYDNARRSLIVYGSNGEFKESIKTGIMALNCSYIGNGMFAFYNMFRNGEIKSCLSVYDVSTKKIKPVLKPNDFYNPHIYSPTSPYNFHYSENAIYFNEPYTNIIYELKEGMANKKYQFLEQGEYPIDEMPKHFEEEDIQEIMMENTFGVFNFFETKNHFMFSILKDKKYLNVFASKQSNLSASVMLLNDERFYGQSVVGVYGDWFVSYLDGLFVENWDEFLGAKGVEIKHRDYVIKNKDNYCNFLVLIKLKKF